VCVIFYDHAAADREQQGFRSGEAGLVMAHPDGGFESDRQLWIPPNSLQRTLSQLQFLVTSASRRGMAVRLRL
jgi:hypothetical protein